jgi:glycosyltransferase involved in cell wall biosynthesis
MASNNLQTTNTRKKLLILIDWFAPGYKAGGPIRSCVNLSLAMKDDFDVFVLTSDRDLGDDKPYPGIELDQWTRHFDPNVNVYYISKEAFSPTTVKKVVSGLNADLIYLNQMFSPHLVIYPIWLNLLGKLKGKLILCPRGALYPSALGLKSYKKLPFLALIRWAGAHKKIRFHATNDRERAAIRKYFPGSEVVVADNLPDFRQLPFASVAKQPGVLKAVFVGRIHPIKNLLFLLQVLGKVRSHVELTIVGPIEDRVYWDACIAATQILPPNINVVHLGPMANDNINPVLLHSHIFILPSTGENFGHSIFESLLVGRPVLLSDQTPWRGLKEKHLGWDLPLARQEAFTSAIDEAASWTQEEFDVYAHAAWEHAAQFIKDPSLKSRYNQLFS